MAVLGSSPLYLFEKVIIEEKSHLIFQPSGGESRVIIGSLDGDLTGMLHVTADTPVDIQDSMSPFPVGFRAYEDSDMGLPEGRFVIYTQYLLRKSHV